MKTKNRKLINGDESFEGNYPFVVSISDIEGNHFCTGSFISPTLVLSSARCFDQRGTEAASVVFGCNDLVTGTCERIPVVETIIHPKYNPFATVIRPYDLALLKLVFKSLTKLPLLPSPMLSQNIFDDIITKQIGWGNLKPRTDKLFEGTLLREADTLVVHNEACQEQTNIIYELQDLEQQKIHESLICSVGNDEGVCQGDLGAPSIVYCEETCQSILLGITSAGLNCGIRGHPSIAARVFSEENFLFIQEHVIMAGEIADFPVIENISLFCPNFRNDDVQNPTAFPTINTNKWSCQGAFYAAQDGCDCGCGLPDPDCTFDTQETFGCVAELQVCNEHGMCEVSTVSIIAISVTLLTACCCIVCLTGPVLFVCGILRHIRLDGEEKSDTQ